MHADNADYNGKITDIYFFLKLAKALLFKFIKQEIQHTKTETNQWKSAKISVIRVPSRNVMNKTEYINNIFNKSTELANKLTTGER